MQWHPRERSWLHGLWQNVSAHKSGVGLQRALACSSRLAAALLLSPGGTAVEDTVVTHRTDPEPALHPLLPQIPSTGGLTAANSVSVLAALTCA